MNKSGSFMGLAFLSQASSLFAMIVFVHGISFGALAANSFYDLTPSPQKIDGVDYPRNGLTQYRGTSDHQMDLSLALRALMGDSTAYVESLFFSTIKNKLLRQPFPKSIELHPFLENSIQDYLRQHPGTVSLSDALKETKKLVDGTFQHMDGRNELISSYVDYSSPRFIDWPQDVVFTTIISPVAATYGNRVLVVKEKSPRGLDLNFWNHANGGEWFIYTRDIGEFITYGYLNPEDLVGYQLRTGSEKAWHWIESAFYKSPSSKAILVFSGKRSDGSSTTCLDLNPADQTYYHCRHSPGRVARSVPALSSEKAQLKGVFVLCRTSSQCDPLPDKEIKKYAGSSEGASTDLSSLNIRINGQILRYKPVGPQSILRRSP